MPLLTSQQQFDAYSAIQDILTALGRLRRIVKAVNMQTTTDLQDELEFVTIGHLRRVRLALGVPYELEKCMQQTDHAKEQISA